MVVARLLSRAGARPGLVFASHRRRHWWCCCRRLPVAPAWWWLLGSSPALVLALGWRSHRIATVIGGGVAVIGCAVVIGVLPGVL